MKEVVTYRFTKDTKIEDLNNLIVDLDCLAKFYFIYYEKDVQYFAFFSYFNEICRFRIKTDIEKLIEYLISKKILKLIRINQNCVNKIVEYHYKAIEILKNNGHILPEEREKIINNVSTYIKKEMGLND